MFELQRVAICKEMKWTFAEFDSTNKLDIERLLFYISSEEDGDKYRAKN